MQLDRFRTGVRDTTIPCPASLHRGEPGAKVFRGPSVTYNFEKQTENYLKLRRVLMTYGKDFNQVSSAHYRGDLHTNHRFVVTTVDGSLLWNKYVGFVAQGGQNHVYVAGRRIKVSNFLGLKPAEQRALLSGKEDEIAAVFSVTQLRYLDEARALWN